MPGGPLIQNPVGMTNGWFNVSLDFGEAAFAKGDARWLQTDVRRKTSRGLFILLNPRREFRPVPFALFAPDAGTAAFAGNETSMIDPGAVSSTIAGEDSNSIETNVVFAAIGGGSGNRVRSEHGTVPGGVDNPIQKNAGHAGVAGGFRNSIDSGGSGGRCGFLGTHSHARGHHSAVEPENRSAVCAWANPPRPAKGAMGKTGATARVPTRPDPRWQEPQAARRDMSPGDKILGSPEPFHILAPAWAA